MKKPPNHKRILVRDLERIDPVVDYQNSTLDSILHSARFYFGLLSPSAHDAFRALGGTMNDGRKVYSPA